MGLDQVTGSQIWCQSARKLDELDFIKTTFVLQSTPKKGSQSGRKHLKITYLIRCSYPEFKKNLLVVNSKKTNGQILKWAQI